LNVSGNQICWLLYKSRVEHAEFHGFKTFQEFLDNKQYSRNGILRYARVFGKDFVSTGGLQTTEEFVQLLNLKSGEKVLDVGCGIGGGAFYMAKMYDAHVTGIDLSSNMISIAFDKAAKINDTRVQFEVCDATKRHYAPGSFDVVYSRDTILHIADKRQLFTSFLTWLKPGGRLLISDYSCRSGDWSSEFTEYVKQRGYILLSVPDYGKLLKDIGFVNVRAEDRTEQFVSVLNTELERMKTIKEGFIQEFSEKDYTDLVTGWQDKIRRCGNGDQKWGLFYAEKPSPV